MKIAFIGAGSIAQAHYNALRLAGAEVVAVHTRSETGVAFADANSDLCYFDDLTTMIEESKPGAVFVLTPPTSYPDILKTLQGFNLPTFLEKPLAHSTSAAEVLRQYLPTTCFVGLNRRFYSNVVPIKQKCDTQSEILCELVLPERVKDYKNRSQDERNFWPMLNGIHCIDLVTHFVGELESLDFVKRWGSVECSNNPQYTHAAYKTKKGHRVNYVSNLDSSGGWRIHLHLRQEQITLSPIEVTRIKSLSGEQELELSEDDKKAKQGFLAQARCFLEGASAPGRLPSNWVSFDDALRSMRVLEALHPPLCRSIK